MTNDATTTGSVSDLDRQLRGVAHEPFPTTLPGFDLMDEIGRGGMGVVYRANDLALGREVAVKILQDRFEPDSTTAVRFIEEARITAQLQHPGVPAAYQVGKLESGRPFLAMKLIKGQTLDALLKANEPLDVPAVFESIAQAVGYAHARGVIHRDLKPQNIMVGAFGEVQVMDWGLSKVLANREARPNEPGSDPDATTAPTEIRSLRDSDGSFTQAGSVLGTPSYMAPEQAGGELDKIDARSDVFGLGAILCAMLTGKPPFEGDTAESVRLNAVRGRTEDAFSRLDACAADSELVVLCKRCLTFEPSHRPASGDEVATEVAALRRAADDRAKTAEREKLSAEVRRRSFQRAAVVVCVVLLVGLIGTGIGLWKADAAKRAALAAEKDADDKRKSAEAETALANAVKSFLQKDVLELADPVTQLQEGVAFKYDADVRLRDVVIRAANKVEGKFTARPVVEAEIRHTIGYTLNGMGRPDLAVKQFEREYEVRRTHLGPDHPYTFACMNSLADSYLMSGRLAEAFELAKKTLELQKEKFGPEHPVTLLSMSQLANSYTALDRHAEALKLREETLALQKEQFGADDRFTLLCMNNLAISYARLGRHAEALKLREETLALQKAKFGPEHSDTLASTNNLANSYCDLGRYADAIKLNEETLPLRKAKFGPDHPDTLANMSNLANSYAQVGRHAEALKLDEETLGLRKAKLGLEHPDTLTSMNNLALRYAALGRHAEALQLYEDTLSLLKAKLGPNHTDTALTIYNIACCHALMVGKAKNQDQQAAVAVRWLQQAVATGYKDVAQMKKDSDLDYLRNREDFKKLMASLEATQPSSKGSK